MSRSLTTWSQWVSLTERILEDRLLISEVVLPQLVMAKKDKCSYKSGLHNDIREMLQVMNDSMNKHTQHMDNLFSDDQNLQIQPSCNGFNMDAYLDWEMTMDKKFAQCCMRDRRKIKIVVSSLTSCALTWWENLCVSNKPQTWKDMKILMREKFYQRDLAEHIPIVSSFVSNILQDNAQNKEDYTEENGVLIMSYEVLEL
jgi:hypothetical protein